MNILQLRNDSEIVLACLSGISSCCLSSNNLGLIAETLVGIIIQLVDYLCS